MRNMLKLVLGLGLMCWAMLAQAQTEAITGKVADASDSSPLAGVTVTNKTTGKRALSDAAGRFTLAAAKGDVLAFSYVGFLAQQVKVADGNNLTVNLKPDPNALEEVVVAMDFKKKPRELGFSAQTLKGSELQETQRENFINALQGRVAGITVNPTAGLAGASSQIVIRGFNSLSQSNQPLFVIDGVITDNSTLDEQSGGGTGIGIARDGTNRNNDYSNRIGDINPNDIENITILKGPEATALYGSQASSGAIIITTKKAKSNKLAVQYDNSFRIQQSVRFPEIFDRYQAGNNTVNSNVFSYFGQPHPEGTRLFDNIGAFFKTGFTQTHNIGTDFGFRESKFRFSGSFFDQDGVVRNNTARRYTLRLSNTTKVGKYLDFTPSVVYTRSENNKVLRSAGGFMTSLLRWPNTNDIRNFEDTAGNKLPLYNTDANLDVDNPLFSVDKNRSRDVTDRVNTTLGVNIRPTSWLTLAGRFGYEVYKTDGYTQYHPQTTFISSAIRGSQDNYYRRYEGYNHTLTATARKKFGNFNTRIMVGTMWQNYSTRMFSVRGDGLVEVGKYDSNNTNPNSRVRLLRNNFGSFNRSVLRQIAYFGEVAVNYKELIYLNYTHRFESASPLPSDFRNFDYPGASISAIMSDIVPGVKKLGLDFWKLRASTARTARLVAPYSNQSVFTNNFASGGGFSYGFTNNNAFLEPEFQETYEVGTEFKFAKNRLSLDATYYNTKNDNQIVAGFRLSYGTGFVLNTQNAGATRNQGVEVTLNASIIKKKDFTWDVTVNFNKMWNKVLRLPASLSEFYLSETWLFGAARGGLTMGNPTTSITAFGYQRNNVGDILINPATGLPVIDERFLTRGDRNPDFTSGINNVFRYKNFNLNFLWDLRVGGDIFNGTLMDMTARGRSFLTEDRFVPRVIKGVLNDGLQNTFPTPNNITITPAFNDQYYSASAMPEEAFIQKNVNWLRLRDVTLSYNLPRAALSKLKRIKSLGAFVTGNDLILITNYFGADPAVNGTTAGSSGVGAFGFDFGTLPTPISVNIGLRAGF
ncbi:MAG: SusC/RagA family TonB-linked outer membrane protein [Bacteroidetes bacterium]|nr:MAG: SusC/RagA family TonB-linked outer membrane protein [Bacteroidota bacterium]